MTENVHALTAHFLDGTSERFDSREELDTAYPPVQSGQSTEDGPVMIAVPLTEWNDMKTQVAEIHGAFVGLVKAMSAMAENPMLRAMGRQFGIDPGAIAEAMKG